MTHNILKLPNLAYMVMHIASTLIFSKNLNIIFLLSADIQTIFSVHLKESILKILHYAVQVYQTKRKTKSLTNKKQNFGTDKPAHCRNAQISNAEF